MSGVVVAGSKAHGAWPGARAWRNEPRQAAAGSIAATPRTISRTNASTRSTRDARAIL